ncbi:MAG: uridine phosphorylase [Planctomycetota bacterium]|jgi:uridine phosphorylase
MEHPITHFTAADLLAGSGGRAFHLNIDPAMLADRVILCGDPGRVEKVARLLSDRTNPVYNRGFVTVTGTSRHGQRITVTTSGMGSPSLEIVAREFSALRRVDLVTRELRPDPKTKFGVIRLGTSGSLQPDIPVGTPIITDWSVGLDNAGAFYDIPAPPGAVDLETQIGRALEAATPAGRRFRGRIWPYASRAHPKVVEALTKSAIARKTEFVVGTTVTAPGLFAAQGRPVENTTNTVTDLDLVLSQLQLPHAKRLTNLEMETAMLNLLGAAFGWMTGAVCIAIANRRTEVANTVDYDAAVMNAAEIIIDGFQMLE